MPPVVLQDYDRHGEVWVLDPDSGRLSPGTPRTTDGANALDLCHGFVHALPHDALSSRAAAEGAALYAESSRLWLQLGADRWDCDLMSVRYTRQPDGTRLLTVASQEGPPREVPVPAPDTGPFDPSYDWTDALADDFFLWAADQLSEPGHRSVLRAHYLRGFAPV
ncbi:hypothetical protein ACFT7S_06700 [Streptomyces sp. NPDC057136]|uniref:hypothetical protein n=1 Tax=Streptomyces sp. NPDC057136 TaxID=3346029 RepID=UPI0036341990